MSYFQSNGHLSDEGIARYAEALKQDQANALPADLRQHIEQCDDCHRQALDLYALIADFDYSQVALPPPAPKAVLRPIWVNRALLAAASVAALIWIINVLWKPGAGHIQPQSPQVVAHDDTTARPSPALKQKDLEVPAPKPKQQAPPAKEWIAANFEPSETLDGLLNDATRSEMLNVKTPANGTTFAPAQPILFSWSGATAGEPLQIVIVNNQNKEQYRLDAGIEGLTFAKKLNPGIYYWKLENETDLLYVGMFFIR